MSWGKSWPNSGSASNTVSLHAIGAAQILAVQQLRNAPGRWRHLDDLHHNHRVLTADEYSSLTSWLDAANLSSGAAMASDYPGPTPVETCCFPSQEQHMPCTAYAGVIPACVRGSVVRLSEDGQAESEHLPLAAVAPTAQAELSMF